MSIPYILSAVLAPFLGGCSDKYGKRTVLAIAAPFMLVAVHMELAFTSWNAVIPLIGQGVAFAVFSSIIWPSVPLVEPNLTGTAYGVMTSIQNIGLAAFPIIIAFLHAEAGSKYIPNCEIFFASLAGLGLCIGLMIHMKDKTNGRILNRTSEEFGIGNSSENDTSYLIRSDSAVFEF